MRYSTQNDVGNGELPASMMIGAEGPIGPPFEARDTEPFPPGAEMILSALDAGSCAVRERRRRRRIQYRMRAPLRLFSDPPGSEPRVVFTRDIDHRGVGFISQDRLPLGYAGYIELRRSDDAEPVRVHCTLIRCREAAPGWYEGAAYFNREQWEFASA